MNVYAAGDMLEADSDRLRVNQAHVFGMSSQLVLEVMLVWAWYLLTTGPSLH